MILAVCPVKKDCDHANPLTCALCIFANVDRSRRLRLNTRDELQKSVLLREVAKMRISKAREIAARWERKPA